MPNAEGTSCGGDKKWGSDDMGWIGEWAFIGLGQLVVSLGGYRYHIAGTKAVFFAREPYANKEAAHVSRFVGLAAVGNKDKQKTSTIDGEIPRYTE
ncbi:Zinc finger CCCH domain-containing protein 59 [Acorus calamus]|uniref:Zinc finger CCCH domain-containing protein 59 n=1 Tax=Acorus calamus TaxID=4465 RepID=A0AAV9E282_ACOCL|nr:Zinc finger CCCH domain-containing protein 59 [Acorus calamus]